MILEAKNEITKSEIMLEANNSMINILDAGVNSQGQQISTMLKKTIAGERKKLEVLTTIHTKELAGGATDAIID
jgi:hypothetical protein